MKFYILNRRKKPEPIAVYVKSLNKSNYTDITKLKNSYELESF